MLGSNVPVCYLWMCTCICHMGTENAGGDLMTDKRRRIDDFCRNYESGCEYDCCKGCPFNTPTSWCHLYSLKNVPDDMIDSIISTIEQFENPKSVDDNPYWHNITKLAEKQRSKGIATYGQGIEDNPADPLTRIQYIEEELIDALMYLEWLKEGLHGKEHSK